jgi:hypothetical protein
MYAQINESKDAPTPIGPTNAFGILRKPSPLMRNPINGKSGISEIADISIISE